MRILAIVPARVHVDHGRVQPVDVVDEPVTDGLGDSMPLRSPRSAWTRASYPRSPRTTTRRWSPGPGSGLLSSAASLPAGLVRAARLRTREGQDGRSPSSRYQPRSRLPAPAPGIGDCTTTALPPAPHACQPPVWFTLHWTIPGTMCSRALPWKLMLGCDIGDARRRFRTGARRGAPGRRDCH
jgi:hypothetical protein